MNLSLRAPELTLVPGNAAPSATPPSGIRLERTERRAFVGSHELALTTQLFDLLEYLLDHRGEAVSFNQLASEVWSYTHGVGDHHFLHTAIYRLRRILQGTGIDDLIEGVRGFGYRVRAEPVAPKAPVMSLTLAASSRAIAVFDPSDPALRLLMANEATLELTGYDIDTLTNLPGSSTRLWRPEEREKVDAVIREALASGCAHASGLRLLRANGEEVAVDLTVSRLDLPDRGPLGVAEVTVSNA